MQVTEIFKKLPKTNCGDCGEVTCIAFALKVQTSQRLLSECPHIDAGDPDCAQVDKVEDSYEEAGNRLEARLPEADFEGSAVILGAEYDKSADLIRIDMLGGSYEVSRNGLFVAGEHCRDSWDKLILYDYVLRKSASGLTGEKVPFQHFPRTPSHVKAFQKRAEAELGRAFQQEPDSIRAILKELRCVEFSSKAGADLACSIDLLPGFPMYIEFWKADEEFPASCKFFVDSSAIDKLDIEYMARLVGKAVAQLVGHSV